MNNTKEEPLVLCLTNSVAENFTANVLLAIGAKPAMLAEPQEAAELARIADATLVNVGTLHARQAEAQRAAVAACRAAGRPWVLDPVAAHLLAYRRAFVAELLRQHPSLVRGNAAEIGFLRTAYASEMSALVVLATGETDVLFAPDAGDGTRIPGGVPMLQRVTATGCAQGAVCAAFLGWGFDPFDAARRASEMLKKAGERAFAQAQTPSRFKMALVDALAEICPAYRT